MLIKAIQTAYKGYKFRSRLEARWAVVFDSLDLKWTYEPEGYDLNGIWYLPDFWVESWNCFFEIKPFEMTETEIDKCKKLSKGKSKTLICIQGNPWFGEYFLSSFFPYGDFEGDEFDFEESQARCEFGVCRKCECFYIVTKDDEDDFSFGTQLGGPCCKTDKWPLGESYNSKLRAAFTAARQARFEEKSNV